MLVGAALIRPNTKVPTALSERLPPRVNWPADRLPPAATVMSVPAVRLPTVTSDDPFTVSAVPADAEPILTAPPAPMVRAPGDEIALARVIAPVDCRSMSPASVDRAVTVVLAGGLLNST